MTTMQIFYDTFIAGNKTTPFGLLAKVDPEEIAADEFLGWNLW